MESAVEREAGSVELMKEGAGNREQMDRTSDAGSVSSGAAANEGRHPSSTPYQESGDGGHNVDEKDDDNGVYSSTDRGARSSIEVDSASPAHRQRESSFQAKGMKDGAVAGDSSAHPQAGELGTRESSSTIESRDTCVSKEDDAGESVEVREDSGPAADIVGPSSKPHDTQRVEELEAREDLPGKPDDVSAGTSRQEERDDGAPKPSMGEQIPRHVHGTAAGDAAVDAHAAPMRRESDVATAVKMVKAVEDDARAVAGSLAALFASLQAALAEVTGSSIEHMRCHSEAAGLLQDASIDAATKGNRFINACLRLNEEMRGVGSLAAQLRTLRQVVDQFDYHASRSLPRL